MITRDIIVDIIENARENSISIYLPTHKAGEEIQQDPIRLKNLLSRIEKDLAETGMKENDIDNLLAEPRELLDHPLFWQHNDQGLALFVSEDYFEYFRIPLDFEPRYMISDNFLVTPLIPMISLEGTFCILTLSQKNVQLLKCTRESVEEIKLEDSPTSLEEFLKYDVNEPHLQHHTGMEGDGHAIFHGQGGSRDTNTEEIINYLKAIENSVTSTLRKRNDPLILTGVKEAIAEYRKVNHYSRLLDKAISINPDPKSNKEIRDEGWKIIKSYFLQDMFSDIERYGNLLGSDKCSENLSSIVEGAFYGKVDSLFIPIGEHSWGRFDEEEDIVHLSKEKVNGEHDLINLATIKTLTQGGNVYALQKDDMPNSSSIAAIFRY